jgi:malate dehydrogenase (oxaloacetate-decarboxylating)
LICHKVNVIIILKATCESEFYIRAKFSERTIKLQLQSDCNVQMEDIMTTNEKALLLHEEWKGKLETVSKTPVKTREDLSLAYTPGVAEPCKVIAEDKEAAYKYTIKSNTVAVVSDGSAVLGLGNIGPYAAMPVMEGKAVLFKEFGNVNAFPICLDTQDTEEIIKTVVNIAPAFGGINLEDISAPRCFEIEERLKELLDIPVFHDDQHGTAIVVLAGIINALKVTGKTKETSNVVVNGAGSAGVAITKLLLTYGFKNIIMCDKCGMVSKDTENLNWMQKNMTEVTNLSNKTGSLADALKGADIFVGVSAPNIVTADMVSSMNKNAILFAMANPVPEIMPDIAKAAGAKVVGTGRSDFPNQVNNVVAFPGIFKGALEGRATQITEEMKLAAAFAIAGLVSDEDLNEDNIMPEAFDPRVAEVVSKAVKDHIK